MTGDGDDLRMKRWVFLLLLCAVALALFLTDQLSDRAPKSRAPAEDTHVAPLPQLVVVAKQSVETVVHGRIVDVTGAPVPAFAVRVDDSEPIACDAQARFEIEALTPGLHSFQATSAERSKVGEAVSLQILEGVSRYDVELVVPRSWTIAGHVVDALDEPVPNVSVRFQDASGSGFQHGSVTGPDGAFRVRVWEAGSYTAHVADRRVEGTYEAGQQDVMLRLTPSRSLRVRIVDPDGVLVPRAKLMILTRTALRGRTETHAVVGGIHLEDTRAWGTKTELRVTDPRDESGEPLPLCSQSVVHVDRALRELEIRLPGGRRVTGQVVDEEGGGIAEVYVTVRDPGALRPAAEVGFAKSDQDGHFVLEALPRKPLLVVPSSPRGPWAEVEPLQLSAVQSSIRIRLVRSPNFQLTVLDSAGLPVANVVVHVSWNDRTHKYRRKATDKAGIVLLEGVSRTCPLAVHVLTDGLDPPLPAFKRLGVPFADGRMTVRLETGTVIRGVVVDADGKPVVRGEVVAEGAGGAMATLTAKTTPHAETGAFTLFVKPGVYRVWLHECPGFSTSEPLTVEAPGKALRIVAPRYASATGRLHVKEPQNWRIEWFSEPRVLVARIGPSGHFTVGGVRKEGASLLATRHGDARVALLENVNLGAGPLDVRPTQGQRISGRVDDTQSASGLRLFIELWRGSVRLFGSVNADMTFSIDNVPPGPWRLELRAGSTRLAVLEGVRAGTEAVRVVVER